MEDEIDFFEELEEELEEKKGEDLLSEKALKEDLELNEDLDNLPI